MMSLENIIAQCRKIKGLQVHIVIFHRYNNHLLLFCVDKNNYEDIFDLRVDEQMITTGINLNEVIHPDDVELFAIADTNKGHHELFKFNFRILKQSKEIIILCAKFNRLQNDDIADSTIFSVQLIDVRDLIQKDDELDISTRNLQAMMKYTNDFIFFKDAFHVLTAASDTLAIITGYKKGCELVGKIDYELFPQEHAEAYYKLEKEIYKGHLSHVEEIQPFVDENGIDGWVDNRKYPIKNSSGEIIGLFGIARIVTENIRNLEKIEKQQKMMIVQSRAAAMGEIISMLAHQWRQPLTTIATVVSLLKIDLALDNFKANVFDDRLNHIEGLVKKMSLTINDFRNFFKPDNQAEEVNLSEVIQTALNMIKHELESDNIRIIKNFHTSTPMYTYKNELIQVLLSLFKNAQDNFINQKTEEPKVEISISEEETMHIIKISDNGGGIPEAYINQIFEPYFSSKDEKNDTGLGLYMSKTIIEKHCKGSLSVRNKKGGAEFEIKLKDISTDSDI